MYLEVEPGRGTMKKIEEFKLNEKEIK